MVHMALLLGMASFLYGLTLTFVDPTHNKHDGITLAILLFANHTGDTSWAGLKWG